MHHKGILVVGPFKNKPYRLTCACTTAGDFPTEAQALAFFTRHTSRIGPTETWELSVPGAQKAQQKPIPPPAPPAPTGAVGEKAAPAKPSSK